MDRGTTPPANLSHLLSPETPFTGIPDKVVVDTADPDEAAAAVEPMLSPHKVRISEDARTFHARVRAAQVGDIHVSHFRYGAAVDILCEPMGCYAVSFVLDGGAHSNLPRAPVVSSGPGEGVAFSPGEASRLRWSNDLQLLCLAVPRSALEDRARRLGGSGGRQLKFAPRVGRDSGRLVRSTVVTALRMSGGRDEPLPSAVSWEIRDAILTAMLFDLAHSESEQMVRAPARHSRVLVDEAVAVMRSTLAAPISMPELARRIAASARSIQEGFREHLGTTPSAYFKELRLNAVHDELRRRSPAEVTVTDVAATIGGFTHLGRFAGEYFERFHEHPAETLRRPAFDSRFGDPLSR